MPNDVNIVKSLMACGGYKTLHIGKIFYGTLLCGAAFFKNSSGDLAGPARDPEDRTTLDCRESLFAVRTLESLSDHIKSLKIKEISAK
jgi:hypothetical protein